ncbi:MAG TPA: M48 family metallopeptidase [Vicinamibacterales bacterium]|nr:M48 family metallopeptidase [Vicinamibacterales bacterium]
MRLTLFVGILLLSLAAVTDAQTAGSQSSIAAADTRTERVPVPEPTPEAVSYYRSGNVLWVITNVWGLLIPSLILFAGVSARLRTWAQRLGRKWFFTIGLYFIAFTVIVFLVDLPLSYYQGYVRQHDYGLSNQTFGKWTQDQVTGLIIGIIGGVLFLWVPYLLLRKSPRRWWLYTGLLAIPFIVMVSLIQPIWIDPLFNTFGPMKDKALEADILRLAERAGIEGSRVYEVAKSEDTNAVNAYVAGVGTTKRIVLWDTILAKLNREQLLVVMGHEMGHYVLGHIWKLILIMSALIIGALYAVHRTSGWMIARYRDRFGFSELSDVASLPLIIVLFSLASLVVTPVALAVQRHFEHEADRFGLEITQDNYAAATAFVKLQQENLGMPRPGRLYKWWRASHPPLGDRIDFSNDYRPWETNQPLVYVDYFRGQ